MHEFKISLALFTIAFVAGIDLYAWQAIKTLFRNHSAKFLKRLRFAHFTGTVLFGSVYPLMLFVPYFTASTTFRVYAGAFIFILYLSKFVICLFLAAEDLTRLLRWAKHHISRLTVKQALEEVDQELKMSRSKFISQAGALTAAVPLVMLTKGIFKGAYDYRIVHVPLYLPKLPSAFNGIRIVQISDIHSGSFFDKDAVKKGVDMIRSVKSDIVFFTGDLVNSKTDEAYDYADIFSAIKAPMGVFSTLGNHDYGDYYHWDSEAAKRKNLEDLYQVHKDLGWNLLLNQNLTLDKGGQRIGIVGVENWGDRGRFQKYGDLDLAKKGMEDVPVKLLLSHDPSHFDSIITKQHKDIDATFAGHTHGFQFGVEIGKLRWSPAQYIYPRWAGLYNEGHQQLYVNRGFGFLGYPGRVGILPEITVFELTNKA